MNFLFPNGLQVRHLTVPPMDHVPLDQPLDYNAIFARLDQQGANNATSAEPDSALAVEHAQQGAGGDTFAPQADAAQGQQDSQPQTMSSMPDMTTFDGQFDAAENQDIFSGDAQQQFPSSWAVPPASFATDADQTGLANDASPAETPTRATRSRSRRTAAATSRSRARSAASSQPGNGPFQQQMNAPSSGMGQTSVPGSFNSYIDPQLLSLDNGAGVPGAGAPGGIAQTPFGVNNDIGHQAGSMMPVDYSMFMNPSASTSSAAAIPGTGVFALNNGSNQLGAVASSNNKRKAPSPQDMNGPSKRHQSGPVQGTLVQNATDHAPAQSLQTAAEGLGPAAQAFDTPHGDSAGEPQNVSLSIEGMPFGKAIKEGIGAAIKLVMREARSKGSIFSQILIHGPSTNFTDSETLARIKRITASHLQAANAAEPVTEGQGFVNGAFQTFQALLQEMEEFGTVFGKQLLLGRVTGMDLTSAKRCMAGMYMEIAGSYLQTMVVDDGTSIQPAQNDQTPAPAPGASSAAGAAWSSIPALGNTANQQGIIGGTMPSSADVSQTPGNHLQLPAGMFPNNAGPFASQRPRSFSYPAAQPTHQGYYTTFFSVNPQPPQQLQQQQLQQFLPATTATPTSSAAATPSTTTAAASTTHPELPDLDSIPSGQGRRRNTRGNAASGSGGTATSTRGGPGTGLYVPKVCYQFSDKTFYVLLTLNGVRDAKTSLGPEGTAAAAQALAEFLREAREQHGVAREDIPDDFVFYQWFGMRENLDNLRCCILGEAPMHLP
ncbi:hypothetical protein VTK56DRAFT_760 [Thermocarpiscus australiensis]